MTKHIFVILIFLSLIKIQAQEHYTQIIDKFRQYDLDKINLQKDRSNTFTERMILWQKDFLTDFNIYHDKLSLIEQEEEFSEGNMLGKFLYHLNYGDYLFYKFNDKNIEARNSYIKALNIAKNNNSSQLICEVLKRLLNLNRFNYLIDNTSAKLYLDLYESNIYDNIELAYYQYYKQILSFQYFKIEQWDKETELYLLQFAEKSKQYYLNGIIYQLVSSYYNYLADNEKAILLERKALENFKKITHNYKSTNKRISQIALARYYTSINQIKEANEILSKLEPETRNKLEKSHIRYVFFYNSIIDSTKNNYKSAFKNLIEYTSRTEQALLHENKNAFDELEAKYQTSEKEKKIVQLLNTNLKTEAKRLKNRNLLIGSLLLLFFVGITAFLINKNTRKKQRIAEQEKELEVQKTEKLLKEQELASIDAMILGQEKERQRLANDLHDNLGSTLATVKLHFQHLQKNQNNPKAENLEEIYHKTNTLLDEAYQKVRTIAHEKNSGVMANQGLLLAVKNLAKKVSNGNNMTVEVQDYGLNERLDNTLEISIFRVIQELITNIIKHANANEIHISLTNHDSLLNIIVEDNGKGFDAKVLPEKEGMGLKNIEKRIEHLEGTFEIDSTLEKGTNIIINIPI